MCGMRTLSVGTKQGRGSFFFHGILGQTPQNDTDAAFSILFLGLEGINTMLPVNVDVSTKAKDSIVWLGEVHSYLVLIRIRRTDKGEFSHCTKRDTYRNVLVFGTLRIKGSRVMMKGLPVGRVLVPVESIANGLLSNVKVDTKLVDHGLERFRSFGLFDNQTELKEKGIGQS